MNQAIRRARRLAARAVRHIPILRRHVFASSDYRIVTEAEAREANDKGWLSNLTALRQERAYAQLLRGLRSGDPRIDFTIAAEALRAAYLLNSSVLEVGCGNGYYSEVFERLLAKPFTYTGIDYSEAMIESARRLYPARNFQAGDATSLQFSDNAFDVVFNGVSLMHIMDYRKAIAEASRVASRACIFHSVPVFQKRETTYFRKYAYGAPVSEIVFNERALIETFGNNGLKTACVWESIPYDVGAVAGESSIAKTFLCTTGPSPAGSP